MPDTLEERDHIIWQLRQRAILEYRRAFLAGNCSQPDNPLTPVHARFIENLAILPIESLCGGESQLDERLKLAVIESRSVPIALAGIYPDVVLPDSNPLHGCFRATNDRITRQNIIGPFVFEQKEDFVYGI